MEIKFNVTGNKRKELVEIIAEITGEKPVYKGMPSAAYEVKDIMISKEGTITFDERTEGDTIQAIIEKAGATGFAAETKDDTVASEEKLGTQIATAASDSGLVISFPADKVNLENLKKLLESKASLIKKALEVEALPIEERDNQVRFPWWPAMPDFDSITSYTNFLAALCKMSKEQKRITAKEKEVDNEKYAFRCFLLRLGFIGAEYKKDRKILLKNFTGSSAFKAAKEVTENELSE